MKRWLRVWPALVWWLCLAPVARAADSRVSGQVVDAASGKPVEGADVELQNTGGGPGYFRARTNAKGEFTLERVQPDRWYTLTVGADGYSDAVIGGWQFPAAQREVRLTMPLDRAGRLALTVTAADGRTGVSAAQVRVRREQGASWWENYRREPDPRFTGRDGRVVFEGLTAGRYTVSVEAAGLRGAEVRDLLVRRGETTPASIALARPAALSGVVRLPDSSGTAGLSVVARGPGEATATTDAEGRFTLADLAPGRYRIEVSHEGFLPAILKEPVTVREGESRDGLVLRARPLEPSLAFVLQREVFTPGIEGDGIPDLKVAVRSFRLGRIPMTLWRVPERFLLEPRADVRALTTSADTSGFRRVRAWTHDTRPGPPYAWREEEMPLPDTLSNGIYVLEGRAGAVRQRTLFFVSDVSLLVKRSAGHVLVWAGSLRTGLPLPGVRIASVPLAGAAPSAGDGRAWLTSAAASRDARVVTDTDGLALVPLVATDASIRIVASSDAHGWSIADAPLAAAARQGGDAMLLFTERPIYRPGQKLYWKLFARRATATGFALPDRTSTTFSLTGPDGASLDVPAVTLSARGSADGAIDLPADLPVGDYTLNAAAGRAAGSATFAVEEYRKPEFKVDVTPDREVLVNGDELRFRVAATYFFGAPVVGAQVRYNLFETRLTPPEPDPWSEDSPDVSSDEGGGYGRVLKTGESRTDVDGRVQLAFTPDRVSYDRRLTLEVEVVDGSDRIVNGRGQAIVGRGLFTLQIRPLSSMVLADQPARVDVLTRDHTGKPVQAAVTVDLDQDAWNPIERRYVRASRPLQSVQATTSALEGRARVTISPARSRLGWLKLRARATDARGNTIGAEASFWVYDENVWSYGYRYPSLEALADKPRYAVGDTVKLLLNSEVANGAALVAVEGRGLRDPRVVHLFGNSALARVVVRAEDAPNLFVAVHVRKGREVHSRLLELPVDAPRHDLKITVTPDKREYRPREEARFTIETRDAKGAPHAAEVALGVVDEAIYGLRPDATPDPHDVFYARRPNTVSTVVSFPTLYYAGAPKDGRDLVRRDFRDVAHWAPSVVTGADGRGEVRFAWPDNLTTWRATARGATDATLVGRALTTALVSKDLLARLALPRHFIAGDEATLVSVVNNRVGAPQAGVQEQIEVRGDARLTGPSSVTSSMAAGGESRSRWAVQAASEPPRGGADASATFTFRARGKSDADALEQTVPVWPRAVPLRPHGAGALLAASTDLGVALPVNLVKSGSRVELLVSPSPAAITLGGVDYLASYPYGCTEQTANALRSGAALVAAMRAANVVLPGWEDPSRRLAPYVTRLLALRTSDNVWGWWRDGEPDVSLTAMAIDALARAAAVGIEAEAAVGAIEASQWAYGRHVAELRTVDGEAFVLAHLVETLALPDARTRLPQMKERLELMASSVRAQPQALGLGGLALAAYAHARLGRASDAKALVARLASKGVADARGLSFPSDPDAARTWWGDATENTSWALLAMLATDPADARAAEIVRWLAARRTGRDWRTTRATGPAAMALAAYLAAKPTEMQGGGRVRVSWNGEGLFDGVVPAAGVSLNVPGTKLAAGDNRVTIAKEGAATAYWAWSARAMVPSPGPASTDGRVTLKREYLRASRTTDRRGRPRWLTSAFDATQPMAVGDHVLVRLTVKCDQARDWLLIEDPKPAGFEIGDVTPAGVERPWGLHAETRDDRAAFFLQSAAEGETVIEYLLRPEIAGRYTALPARLEGMYDPDLVVRSGESSVEITGR